MIDWHSKLVHNFALYHKLTFSSSVWHINAPYISVYLPTYLSLTCMYMTHTHMSLTYVNNLHVGHMVHVTYMMMFSLQSHHQ